MRITRWLYTGPLRLRSLLRRGRVEQELDEEIRYHLERQIEQNIANGLTRHEARHAALRAMGGIEQRKEECRDMRRVNFIENLIQDLRYTGRMLRRSPGFAAVAVISLALGIGANTAVFSLVDALLLKQLPVKNPRELVFFTTRNTANFVNLSFSFPAFEQIRDRTRSFSGIFVSQGARSGRMTVSGEPAGADIETVRAERVSGSFFSTLGVETILGRTFVLDDNTIDNPPPVTVISHAFWQRRFAGDPQVIGRNITISGRPFTIIGVTPQTFSGIQIGSNPDMWLPLSNIDPVIPGTPVLKNPTVQLVRMMARLKPGATLDQAGAEVEVIYRQTLEERAAAFDSRVTRTERERFLAQRIEVQSGSTGWTRLRQQFTEPLLILMAIVGSVLLIACANVAGLLLARGTARRKELAVRLAIGSGRLRLVRQLFTESLSLAFFGAILGSGLAYAGVRMLLTYLPADPGNTLTVSPDLRILTFTAGVSVLSAIIFGLVPALRATRLDLAPSLKDQFGGLTSRLVLNKLLVAFQVALSLVVIIGAGLFIQTLQNLQSVDTGFQKQNVVLFGLDGGPFAGRSPVQWKSLYLQMRSRLEAIPGVQSASFSTFGLLSDENYSQKVQIDGYIPKPDEDVECAIVSAGPRFFETLSVPVSLGRGFGQQDMSSSVAVINEVMAKHFFGSENPVGRHFRYGGSEAEIIGIAKDVKYRTLREERRCQFYIPVSTEFIAFNTCFSLRTATHPSALVNVIGAALKEFDPAFRSSNIRTMEEVVDTTIAQERLIAQLASFFGLTALLLCCVGLYGILSYFVTGRTHEIGIRIALGARIQNVVTMMMREMGLVVVAGVVAGLSGAFILGRAVSSLLFGLTPTDPWTIASAVLFLLAAATIAAYLPARRASRLDPLVALRQE